MKDIYILGVESSCDETSLSIVKNGCEEIKTVVLSQIDIHKQYGGVVPEIASRYHVQNITLILEELFLDININISDINAIAVTYGPGLNGCLLVGVEFAKVLSYILEKPLIGVNHIAGHIYAGGLDGKITYPAIALVISGGHTDLVYLKKAFSFEIIGSTLDDAVGECYDKVAKILGLEYPGGPLLDKLSLLGEDNYKLPIPLNDDSYNFSFSGLKSAVLNLVHNQKQRGNDVNKENLACSFQNVVITSLLSKTKKAINDFGVNTLIIAGGVSANTGIRKVFTDYTKNDKINLVIPKINHCTDNAAMIASAGYYQYLKNDFSDYTLNANPNLKLKKEDE